MAKPSVASILAPSFMRFLAAGVSASLRSTLTSSRSLVPFALALGLTSSAACDSDKDDPDEDETTQSHGDTTTTTTTTTTSTSSDVTDNNCGPECDVFMQNCAPTEQCAPYKCDPQALAWDKNICVPVGPRTLGESCESPETGKTDQYCDRGLMCWGGICKEQCTGSKDDPLCSSASDVCLLDLPIATCMKRCNPLDEGACDPMESCLPSGRASDANDFACLYNGFVKMPAARGEPCEFLLGCTDGNYCTFYEEPGVVDAPGCEETSCCTAFCLLDGGDDQCEGPLEKCVQVLKNPDPGAENYGWCLIPRD